MQLPCNPTKKEGSKTTTSTGSRRDLEPFEELYMQYGPGFWSQHLHSVPKDTARQLVKYYKLDDSAITLDEPTLITAVSDSTGTTDTLQNGVDNEHDL